MSNPELDMSLELGWLCVFSGIFGSILPPTMSSLFALLKHSGGHPLKKAAAAPALASSVFIVPSFI